VRDYRNKGFFGPVAGRGHVAKNVGMAALFVVSPVAGEFSAANIRKLISSIKALLNVKSRA
jgi:hypothetical protein